MVRSCICSVTRTILEPNTRCSMSSGVSEAGWFGSIRLLLVFEMMFMETMRTVSVT